ncbi:hypothetical protein [Sulfurimonas sp. C5]|uniref:hypothetical protein n=1 Tax=Sulfurimonas sp. C5 TaxID=3036947 RepID=UPI002454FB1B|nr:hypothetical protein [Sulfurimonas sp. C5]MDH4945296.1 hypothetical protein [Sulfurimonas sp. C5]
MEELFNLTYKEEVEELKDEDNFEALGDAKYIEHDDFEARLYWAFCRPSGSHPKQIEDKHPLVSIMAFNHSRLGALERFSLLHKDVIADDELRKKVRNRARMLFRDLVDNDFDELNKVLEMVPMYIDVAVDQLINGRMWNDIVANEIEATIFLEKAKDFIEDNFLEAFYGKLQNFEEFEASEIKSYLEKIVSQKQQLSPIVLEYYHEKALEWLDECDLHILQKKGLENLTKKLI